MNSIILVGRLTRDPEMRYTQDQKAVARFSIAVRRDAKKTDFFNCTAFGNTAGVMERYVHKGDIICIRGSVESDTYINRDGIKMPSFTIVVGQLTLCGSKPGSANSTGVPHAGQGEGPQKAAQAPTRHTSEEYSEGSTLPQYNFEDLPFG